MDIEKPIQELEAIIRILNVAEKKVCLEKAKKGISLYKDEKLKGYSIEYACDEKGKFTRLNLYVHRRIVIAPALSFMNWTRINIYEKKN